MNDQSGWDLLFGLTTEQYNGTPVLKTETIL